MRSHTGSITLDAPATLVHEFVANAENLPRWAVGFARSVRREGDGWIVVSSGGDIPLRIEADARLGTVDFHMRPMASVEVVAFSRVVANGDGSEYVFTFFQSPGVPDDLFLGQVTALEEELVVLRSIVKAQRACAVGASRVVN